MSRTLALCALTATLVACATPDRSHPMTSPLPSADLRVRIDSFHVPAEARAEFDAAMHRNMEFIRTLPGFLGHVVYERVDGPSSFNVVTVATWESQAAVDGAVREVRAHYQRIGFDPPAFLARLGARGELGSYRPVR